MNKNDISEQLQAVVRHSAIQKEALNITGGNSKQFYGRTSQGEPLDVTTHYGVINYEPTELVITARGGTPLSEIEDTLAGHHQMLPFEPPGFDGAATLGGCVATGLSGPARPYRGAVRDYVLGTKVLNGKGEILSFGGEVMKNVAGYDVSRLMTGAMGTLGVLLEISLKVLPQPAEQITVCLEEDADEAIKTMNTLAGQPLPISAMCHIDGIIYIRLSGTSGGVNSAQYKTGGDGLENGDQFWQSIRNHQHDFFNTGLPLWRLSVAPGTPQLTLKGEWLLDWGGAQRWLKTELPADDIRHAVETIDGHATLFRGNSNNADVFHPLPSALMAIHTRLKRAFDPNNILNPNRMYKEW